MRPSSLNFTVRRLIESPDFVGVPVWPIAPESNARGVVINRTNEVVSKGLRQSVVVISCQAPEPLEADDLGESVIDCLHGVEGFACDGADDIEFQKGGVDVTSLDTERELFLREIEFVVSW